MVASKVYGFKYLLEQNQKWKRDPNYLCTIWATNEQTRQKTGAFPVFKNDTLGNVVKKWAEVFSDDAYLFNEEMKNINLHKESGMSHLGKNRLAAKIPDTLLHVIKVVFPDFTKNPKNLMKLKPYLPRAFIGRMA
jgi:hypothetical protein